MDDLLQSLASPGQGSTPRSRTPNGDDERDGAAFGLAFDAATSDAPPSNGRPAPDEMLEPNVLPAHPMAQAVNPVVDRLIGAERTTPLVLPMPRHDGLQPLVLPMPAGEQPPVLAKADTEQPLVLPQPGSATSQEPTRTAQPGSLVLPMPDTTQVSSALGRHPSGQDDPLVLPMTGAGARTAAGQPQVLPGVPNTLSRAQEVLPQTQPQGPQDQRPRGSGDMDPQVLPQPKVDVSQTQGLTAPHAGGGGDMPFGREVAGPLVLPQGTSPNEPIGSLEPSAASNGEAPRADVVSRGATASAGQSLGRFGLQQTITATPIETATPAQPLGDVQRVGSGDWQPSVATQSAPGALGSASSTPVPFLAETLVVRSPDTRATVNVRHVGDGPSDTSLVRPSVPPGVTQTSPPIGATVTQLPQFNDPDTLDAPQLEARIGTRANDATPMRIGSWTPTLTDIGQTAPQPLLNFTAQPATLIGPETMPQVPDGMDLGLHSTTVASTTTIGTTATPVPMAPTANAHAMAQQIANALGEPRRDPGGIMELALDPPELGRLRMQMSEVAGMMTLTIQAERPETAELMRRHLDLLAQEFAAAGLNAPNVNISQDGAGQDGQDTGDNDQNGHAHQALVDDTPLQTPPPARTGSGALDLRL